MVQIEFDYTNIIVAFTILKNSDICINSRSFCQTIHILRNGIIMYNCLWSEQVTCIQLYLMHVAPLDCVKWVLGLLGE